MKVTETIAKFIIQTTLKEISAEAIDIAKSHILDCIGVTIAGSADLTGKIITNFVREMGGEPKTSVVCGGFRTSAPQAALANGVMAHAIDYDDDSDSILGHPTAVLLPAVLALGEEYQVSGINVIEAYILGLEIAAKIGSIINMEHYVQGWHSTGTIGILGAAVASAKIMRLSIEQTKVAIGIAASSSCGLRQNFGTMTKPFHAGNAARGGVMAAMLAQRGFTADREILENPFGFFNLFCGKGKYRLDNIEKLGHPFDIISPGVSIKKYPCCGGTHSSIDAILYLIDQHGINSEMVDNVECTVHPIIPEVLIHSRPKTALEGKFSMEFCLAIALIDKKVGLKQFTDEKVLNLKTQDLLKRIKMRVTSDKGEKDYYKPFSIVKITLKNGKEYSHRVEVPEGSPQKRLSREKLIQKFEDCCKLVFTEGRIKTIIGILKDLEKLPAINKLLDLVRHSES